MDWSEMMITKLYAVNTMHYHSAFTKQRSHRPNCGFLIKAEGSTVYTVAGKQYTGDSAHIVYLPRGATYEYTIVNTGVCYGIEFDAENAPAEPFVIPLKNPVDVIKKLPGMCKCWNEKRRGYLARSLSDVYAILGIAATAAEYRFRNKEEHIQPSVEYMHRNYLSTDITNADIAAQSDVSEVYFRKIFTSVYGVSPRKYILNLRIKHAMELLRGDYSSVEAVALASGYTNVYHFCKSFKSETGMIPSQYAKQI